MVIWQGNFELGRNKKQTYPQNIMVFFPKKALIFSKTAGYRHDSISAGVATIATALTGLFDVTASEDAEAFFADRILSQFQIVILLQTSGDFLTSSQLNALKEYVMAGGGIYAIHGAAAGE